MFHNIKVDIIYYKTNTDFELEFNLCGCCKMRLLTDKASDKKNFLHILARDVSRSRVVIIIGNLFGTEGIINCTSHAIGKSLTDADCSAYGIKGEKSVSIMSGSTPLVTREGYFGGCIIESGPQSMILLTENKNIRKTIMKTLIHPYIEELCAIELKENALAAANAEPEEIISKSPQAPKAIDTKIPETPTVPQPNANVLPDSATAIANNLSNSEAVNSAVDELKNSLAALANIVPTITNEQQTKVEEHNDDTSAETPETINTTSSTILNSIIKQNIETNSTTNEENNEPEKSKLIDDNFKIIDNNNEEIEPILFNKTNDGNDDQYTGYTETSEDLGLKSNKPKRKRKWFNKSEDLDTADELDLRPSDEEENTSDHRISVNLPILIASIVLLLAIAVLCYSIFYIPSKNGVSISNYLTELLGTLFGKK